MILCIDTETTGLDLYHDARPFFFTSHDHEDNVRNWEWRVNPLTRMPDIPKSHIKAIRELIDDADVIVGQNIKFDVTALISIGVYESSRDFPWHKTEDTLMAGHLLYSAESHRLDDLVYQYLGESIKGFEEAMKVATEEARRLTRRKQFIEDYGLWKIAKKFEDGMPSAKGKCWKMDTWLPLEIAHELEYPADHEWFTVTEEYASADSYFTLQLWKHPTLGMEQTIRSRDLWEIYRERMKVLPIALEMESAGISLSGERMKELRRKFTKSRYVLVDEMVEIARNLDYKLDMPRSGNNPSLTNLVFDVLECPVVKRSEKTLAPSLDKEVIEHYELFLPENTTGREFIERLSKKRKLDTALQYIDGYERYWVPTGAFNEKGEQAWYLLHPSLNPTGTVQLRWSSSNPNEQNISKQEGYNLRYTFGPEDGWEWWSLDAQNIELRIPAFEAPEPDLVNVFLRPKDPPYFGSYHLVVFDLLHPELFKKHGTSVKELFESSWYQWVKNGNFAFIYGAQKKRCDATYHVVNAYEMVRYRFPEIAKLADLQVALARKNGQVETIPDRTVNPRRGFPIMASRTNEGGVLPTTPLNYHVSGTAMQWTNKGMVRCHEQLEEWRKRKKSRAHLKMQVHDEMVFAFEKSRVDPREDLEREKKAGQHLDLGDYKSNLGRVRVLQRLMEKGGDDIGIPTPVGVELNADNWAEVTLKC